MFPPHTHPFQFPLCFYLFHPLTSFSSEKSSSDSLQKAALQRAVTACDMKDCNLSGLKYLMWVVSTCSSILSPWNEAKHKKEYKPGNEGISNIKIASHAVDHLQVASTALLYCTWSQPKIITKSCCPENLFEHLKLNNNLFNPSGLPIRELKGKKIKPPLIFSIPLQKKKIFAP